MKPFKYYKSIAYAYPTSITATELGFKDDGCYYIQLEKITRNRGKVDLEQTIYGRGYAMPNDETMKSKFHELNMAIHQTVKNTRQPWRWGDAK